MYEGEAQGIPRYKFSQRTALSHEAGHLVNSTNRRVTPLLQHQTIWQRAWPDLGDCTSAPRLKGANSNSKRFKFTTREIGRGHEELIGSYALALQCPFRSPVLLVT